MWRAITVAVFLIVSASVQAGSSAAPNFNLRSLTKSVTCAKKLSVNFRDGTETFVVNNLALYGEPALSGSTVTCKYGPDGNAATFTISLDKSMSVPNSDGITVEAETFTVSTNASKDYVAYPKLTGSCEKGKKMSHFFDSLPEGSGQFRYGTWAQDFDVTFKGGSFDQASGKYLCSYEAAGLKFDYVRFRLTNSQSQYSGKQFRCTTSAENFECKY